MDIFSLNRKKVLGAVKRATGTAKGGIRATDLPKKTGLCLRTCQTHLRALRDEAKVINHRGLWLIVE